MKPSDFASLFVTGAQEAAASVQQAAGQAQAEIASVKAGIDEAKMAAKAALIMQAISTGAVVVMAYCALRGLCRSGGIGGRRK